MTSPKKPNSNQSSPSTSPSLARRKTTLISNTREYCVELALGSAKGRTQTSAVQDENLGEVRFVDEDRNVGREVKLFVPDEDDVMLLQAVREAVLRKEDHAQPQQRMFVQQRRVLYLKVVKCSDGNGQQLRDADLETALDLDSLLPRLDIAPVHFNLPLISRLNPEEVDLGHLQMEISFERQVVVTSTANSFMHYRRRGSLAALQEMLPTSEEEFESMTTTTGNGMLLMAPSAVALLAACCTLTSSVATEHRSFSHSPRALDIDVSRKRRLSCPATSEFTNNTHMVELCHNREQLAGLREGWRMWRLADKTKYEPSHRAHDVAMVGERFLNREAASSFFEPTEPQTLPAVWLKRLANTITPPVTGGSEQGVVWCRGKTVLLTGATSGIGQEIGRELCARQVKRLIILCRKSGRSQAREWTQRYKGVEVDVIQCDLASMLETNRAAEQVLAMLEDAHEELDAMVLCAATISSNGNHSNENGLEPSLAVNYMANYLLVHALFSSLNKQDARIILAGCSNSLVKHEVFDLDSLQQQQSSPGPLEGLGLTQYMRSKSMLSCFASELSSKLESSYPNITCVMFYPGAVKSKLADKVLHHVNPTLAKLADVAYGLMQGVLVRTPQQGAVLGVFLCSIVKVQNGKVFHSGFTGEVTDFSAHEPFGMAALDRENRQKLWTVTGKLLNQQLGKESKMTEWWGLFKPERPVVV